MSSNNYNIDEATELLFQGYKNEMVNEGFHFSSEVRRWFNLWSNKSPKRNKKKMILHKHMLMAKVHIWYKFHEIVLLTF